MSTCVFIHCTSKPTLIPLLFLLTGRGLLAAIFMSFRSSCSFKATGSSSELPRHTCASIQRQTSHSHIEGHFIEFLRGTATIPTALANNSRSRELTGKLWKQATASPSFCSLLALASKIWHNCRLSCCGCFFLQAITKPAKPRVVYVIDGIAIEMHEQLVWHEVAEPVPAVACDPS